ncbi:MAG: preprotein translocase subunit SecG [Bacteroidota bacterium]
MFTLLIIVIAIIALLITLVVLLQSGKGGGLAGIASGGATTQILGARQAPDVLERATWVLGWAFIVLCVLTNFAIDRGTEVESVIQQRGTGATEQTAPALPPPSQELPPAQQLPPSGSGGASTPDGGSN